MPFRQLCRQRRPAHMPATAIPHQHARMPLQLQPVCPSSDSPSCSARSSTDTTDSIVAGVPQSILIISTCSASLTMASCVFNTRLPIYFVTELQLTMRSMGLFEGLLEAFSYMVRMCSGASALPRPAHASTSCCSRLACTWAESVARNACEYTRSRVSMPAYLPAHAQEWSLTS